MKKSKRINKNILFTALRIFISVSLFTFLIIRNWTNLKNILTLIKSYNPVFLMIAVALFALGISVQMLRWDILLKAQEINISKSFLIQSYYIGYFYSNIFPTNVGGDIYRCYDIYKNKNIRLENSISAVIVERLIGLFSATLFVAISFFSIYKYLNPATVLSLSLLPISGIILILAFIKPETFKLNRLFLKIRFLKRFELGFNSLQKHFAGFKNKTRYLTLSFSYSFISQLIFFASFYFANLYSRVNLDFFSFFFINPIITLSANIPISIGGIGIRENITVFLLKKFNIAEAHGVIFALVILFIIMLNTFVGGITYVVKNIFYKSKGFL
ncbi:MAG: flippase-like domain-containing protein [Actinobacteria bacterium]|nr:flippase-like domain-containing protein [Actinomycetota bacterium]